MSETVSSTYYVSIPVRPHFSELFAFVNDSVLIVFLLLFSLLELELPYFSIDNAHLMYNAYPFWCIDNAHDVFFDR